MDPTIFIAGGVGLLVGYIVGVGSTLETLRTVEKIVDKSVDNSRGFKFTNWLQSGDEDGALLVPDVKEKFNKADKLEDLLQ